MLKKSLKTLITLMITFTVAMTSFPSISITANAASKKENKNSEIGDDELFYEYNKYLDNAKYFYHRKDKKTICIVREIDKQVDHIYGKANSKSTILSAFRSNTQKDPIGLAKAAVYMAVGSDKPEKEIEEELAESYLKDMYNDKSLSNKFSPIKVVEGYSEDVATLIDIGLKNEEEYNRFVETYKELEQGPFKDVFTDRDIRVVIREVEKEDNWDSISKTFRDIGSTVDYAEAVLTLLETMMIQKGYVRYAKALINKDSVLYTGLEEFEKSQTTEEMAKSLIEKGLFKHIAKYLEENGIEKLGSFIAGNGNSGASGTVAIGGFFWKYIIGDFVLGFVLKIPDANDVLKVTYGGINQSTLLEALRSKRIEIGNNYKDRNEDKVSDLNDDYAILMTMYLTVTKDTAKRAMKIASSNKDKKALKKTFNKYKSKLTYDRYIDSCKKNAQKDLEKKMKEDEEANNNLERYKAAYLKTIKESYDFNNPNLEGALIYLDNDDVPELVLSGYEDFGYFLYGYGRPFFVSRGGGVYKKNEFYYIPKADKYCGYFYDSTVDKDGYKNCVLRFYEGGGWVHECSNWCNMYHYDNESISYEEYNEKMQELKNKMQADGYVKPDYKPIKELLEG